MNRLQWKEWYRQERLSRKEVWKDVIGYEGLYFISSLGSVKNKRGRLMKLYVGVNGYKCVGLTNGRQKKYYIHRLVSVAFIVNEQNKPIINHINGIKTDNYVENLEWCTQSENMLHSWNVLDNKSLLNSKKAAGKLHPKSKKVLKYDLSGVFMQEYESIGMAGKINNVNYKNIWLACVGRLKTAGGYKWKLK